MANVSIDVKISNIPMGPGEAGGSISLSASSPKCPDDRDAIPAFAATLVAKALAPYAKIAADDAKKLEDANAALTKELESLRVEVGARQSAKEPKPPKTSLLERAAKRADEG